MKKITHLLLSATLAVGSSALYAADSSSQSTTGTTGSSSAQSGMTGQSGQSGMTGQTGSTTTGSQAGQSQQQSGTQAGQQGQQLPADMSASRFQALDQNSDGYISRQEAGADGQLTVIFLDVDENRDEQLSSEEFSSYEGAEESNQ